MRVSEYKKLKPSKYRAIKTTIDGHRFPSLREGRRYGELKFLEKHGKITGLELQPEFPIVVCGVKVCMYRADFQYWSGDGIDRVVEDCKGFRTPIFKLKKN